jgi:hypothetical protein
MASVLYPTSARGFVLSASVNVRALQIFGLPTAIEQFEVVLYGRPQTLCLVAVQAFDRGLEVVSPGPLANGIFVRGGFGLFASSYNMYSPLTVSTREFFLMPRLHSSLLTPRSRQHDASRFFIFARRCRSSERVL